MNFHQCIRIFIQYMCLVLSNDQICSLEFSFCLFSFKFFCFVTNHLTRNYDVFAMRTCHTQSMFLMTKYIHMFRRSFLFIPLKKCRIILMYVWDPFCENNSIWMTSYQIQIVNFHQCIRIVIQYMSFSTIQRFKKIV